MSERLKAIMVPGLGPNLDKYYRVLASGFNKSRVGMSYFPVEWWSDKEGEFEKVRNRFFDKIDKMYNGRDRVSLLGISAGGPLTLGALVSLEDMVRGVVTVAGCNRPLDETNRKAYEKLFIGNDVFKEMMENFGETMKILEERKDLAEKVMTGVIKGDDVVPNDSQSFDGARLLKIPTIKLPYLTYHESSIALGVIRSGEMIKFWRDNDNTKVA